MVIATHKTMTDMVSFCEKQHEREIDERRMRRSRSFHIETSTNNTERRKSSSLTPVSLFTYAIYYRDNALLEKLLEKYPYDINELTEEGLSPLHLACLQGNMEIIKLLLRSKARINIVDWFGKTPLDYAVFEGQFDVAQFLIQNGSDLTHVRDGIMFNIRK